MSVHASVTSFEETNLILHSGNAEIRNYVDTQC